MSAKEKNGSTKVHKLELIRVEQTGKVTIGVLKINGESVCWTLEEPWRDNQENVSCIPVGRYPLALEYSPSKKRKLWTIKGVPHRTYVRIHKGNTVNDTEGCPLVGTKPGFLEGKRAVLNSRIAFNELMEATKSWNGPAEIVVRAM